MNNRSQFEKDSRGGIAIIAPAGFGKTEYIASFSSAQCGSTLILTHTNAGVFALRKRLASRDAKGDYRIVTIAAWCEAWVSAYSSLTNYDEHCDEKDANPSTYFKWLYEEMYRLSAKAWFRKTMQVSYGHVLVDEYQDCTASQHRLFLGLAEFMPVVVLGDPLQGVFYWVRDDPIVNWRKLSFQVQPYESKPWRWINSGRPELGDYISSIREDLLPVLNGKDVCITLDRNCPYVKVITPDEVGAMQHWDGCGTVVYVTNLKRAQYAFSQRHISFQSTEPIDNRDALRICAAFDNCSGASLALTILSFAETCFSHASQELKSYRARLEKGSFDFGRIRKHPAIGAALIVLESQPTPEAILKTLSAIREDGALRLHRGVFFGEVCRALKVACAEGVDVTKALGIIRAQGKAYEERTPYRFISSRTVLSKGLEYDTAVVDAEGLKDPRDFYVAISRCKKNLIIVSNSNILRFGGLS